MFQMKEQDNHTPPTKQRNKQVNQVEISNLPKKEFKVTIVKMIKEEKRKMDEQSEKK